VPKFAVHCDGFYTHSCIAQIEFRGYTIGTSIEDPIMTDDSTISRRHFLGAAATVAAAAPALRAPSLLRGATYRAPLAKPLDAFTYSDVTITSSIHEKQLHDTLAVLQTVSDESLLKPLRAMSGQPAPGDELGGWYLYAANYDVNNIGPGFAPACTFGQWVSAFARYYAITGDPKLQDRIVGLNRAYAKTITGDFYENNRFPAYCYDKFVCALMDSHQFAGDSDAFRILDQTTDVAMQHLPAKAVEHDHPWRKQTAAPYTWDESYTISENLFIAYQRGAGDRYKALGMQYLDDIYYDPLSEGRSNLVGRHAYSHVNSLSSAMQAYLTAGSEKHLRAATNGFDFLAAQSFATGGWGPNETLCAPDSDDLFASLSGTHRSFETPCGSYAHFKLTSYLLRTYRDSRYGDSMERVMYNTILGAKPLEGDGHTFYYADYNFAGKKFYHPDGWPCCSGTLPQVAADYRIHSYLRDSSGVYVNLYIPSSLRFTQSGAAIALTQTGNYPFESAVAFRVQATRPAEFALNFRIPAWAQGASVAVNGNRVASAATPGTFATIRREWKDGDEVDLELPLKTRLESLDARHPDAVALLYGPLVLFPIGAGQSDVTRGQLLAATQNKRVWTSSTPTGQIRFLPYMDIADEPYSTYMQLA
jgi:DUF1680 family protein